jgi:hypothetical protein
MPTIEEFKDVYILPDETDATYDKKRRLLTWYANDWLVKCAGYEHYGPTVRPFKLAVSSKKLDGIRVPIVAMESEAFGRLMFENCRDKWIHIVPEKIKNDKWEIPSFDKKDKTTHKYHHTKYSDKNARQVKGAGWSPQAFDDLSQYITDVKAFRKEDRGNGNAIHKLCKDLIREEMKVTDDKFTLTWKRGGKAKPARPKYNDVAELSDEYSLGSEDSSGEF